MAGAKVIDTQAQELRAQGNRPHAQAELGVSGGHQGTAV